MVDNRSGPEAVNTGGRAVRIIVVDDGPDLMRPGSGDCDCDLELQPLPSRTKTILGS